MAVDEIDELPAGPGDVTLRIIATGICGSDIHGFTGHSGRRHPGQVMGHETVGRITAIGEDVPPSAGVAIGDLATINPVLGCRTCALCGRGMPQRCARRRVIGVDPEIRAAFAERLVVPHHSVVTLPGTMPPQHGALVEPLAVGYHAARRAGCSAESKVLVIGGGPIGQACLLAAARLGASRVVVSEPQQERRRIVAGLNAQAVDPSSSDIGHGVREALGGAPDIVLDAVGSSDSLATALSVSELGATVALVGMNDPQIQLDAYQVSTGERTVVGSFSYTPEDFTATAHWVGDSPDLVDQLIGAQVSWNAVVESFAAGARGEHLNKVLFVPEPVSTDDAISPALMGGQP